MKYLVAHETRRTKDTVSRREEGITVEALRFGRGAENEVYLPDPRVPLQFARLRQVGDRLVIQAEGSADLRVNGVVLRTASVSPGDTIGLGPYEITIDEPPDGVDTAITVRLVEPLGTIYNSCWRGARPALPPPGCRSGCGRGYFSLAFSPCSWPCR